MTPAARNVFLISENSAAGKLAADWGWRNPPEEVIQIAERSLEVQNTHSGQILVDWQVIDADTRDRLLKKKPAEIPTLEYFAEQEPGRVLQYVEQILALKNGYPFYERLSLLEPNK